MLSNCTSIGNTGAGIRVTGAGTRLLNNTVKGNGTNYDIADGSNLYELKPAWSQKIPTSERFVLVLDGAGVLDKETGLVWDREGSTEMMNWLEAIWYCYNLDNGDRKGWRLPTVDELASLIDPLQANPALPPGYAAFFDDVTSDS